MKLSMVEGERETAGYEVGVRAASLYSSIWPFQEFAILWISPRTALAENGARLAWGGSR